MSLHLERRLASLKLTLEQQRVGIRDEDARVAIGREVSLVDAWLARVRKGDKRVIREIHGGIAKAFDLWVPDSALNETVAGATEKVWNACHYILTRPAPAAAVSVTSKPIGAYGAPAPRKAAGRHMHGWVKKTSKAASKVAAKKR